jgi:hypothetical protein
LSWPKEHLIAFIEWRVRDWISGEPEEGLPSRKDLELWLSRERDGLPWPKIALKHYGSQNTAAISKARRTYKRVRRYHPAIDKKLRQKPGPKPKSES